MGNGADYGPPQSAAPATPTPDPSTVEALRAQTEGATRDSAAPAAPMPLPSQVAAPRGGNFAPIPPQAAVAPDPSAVPNPSAVSNRMGGDEASARRLWQVVAQSFKAAEQRAIPSEDIDNVGSIAGAAASLSSHWFCLSPCSLLAAVSLPLPSPSCLLS